MQRIEENLCSLLSKLNITLLSPLGIYYVLLISWTTDSVSFEDHTESMLQTEGIVTVIGDQLCNLAGKKMNSLNEC